MRRKASRLEREVFGANSFIFYLLAHHSLEDCDKKCFVVSVGRYGVYLCARCTCTFLGYFMFFALRCLVMWAVLLFGKYVFAFLLALPTFLEGTAHRLLGLDLGNNRTRCVGGLLLGGAIFVLLEHAGVIGLTLVLLGVIYIFATASLKKERS